MPRILILCMLLIGGKSVLALTTTAPLVQQEDISLVQNSPKPNVTCFCWCAGIPPIIRAIIPVCSTCPHSATGVPFPPTTNCTNTTNTTAEIISKSNESPDAVIRDQRTLIAGITPSPFPNITCLAGVQNFHRFSAPHQLFLSAQAAQARPQASPSRA